MSHIWMSRVPCVNETCHIRTRIAGLDEALDAGDMYIDTYEWVMSYIWLSHVTYINESCLICTRIAGLDEPLSASNIYIDTYERVLSHIWMSRDVGDGGRDPQKQQMLCTTLKKRQKQKISWAVDEGVYYSMTGTSFPYSILLCTICLVWGNGTLWVQITQKTGFDNEKVKNGYRQPGYLPPPPMSQWVMSRMWRSHIPEHALQDWMQPWMLATYI